MTFATALLVLATCIVWAHLLACGIAYLRHRTAPPTMDYSSVGRLFGLVLVVSYLARGVFRGAWRDLPELTSWFVVTAVVAWAAWIVRVRWQQRGAAASRAELITGSGAALVGAALGGVLVHW